jgi:hypothetical protein
MAKAIIFIKDCFAAVVIAFFLNGCAGPIQTKTEYVTVPAIAPPTIARPQLAIDQLKTGDGPDVVIRAYSITIKSLEGYAEQLESALNAYKPKDTK